MFAKGSNTFEDFQKWKESFNAKKFEQALTHHDKPKKTPNNQLNFNAKELQKP